MKGLAVIFALLFLFSCEKGVTDKQGQYLAKVGKNTITQEDFDREFEAMPDYAKQMFEGEEGRLRFLDEIIKKELLYQEALKKGIGNEKGFKEKMEEFKKITLISELFEKEIVAKAKVSDEDVKDFYEKNSTEFASTSEIKASHILVKTEDEAGRIIERLGKGEKFGDVAKAFSIDKGSAKNGGDLGYFSKGQMVPEFEYAAAALKVGETSSPVKTAFGYHIIKVTDKKQGPSIEFGKVKDMISQRLSREKEREVFEKYIADLRSSYKPEINNEAFVTSPETEDKPKENMKLDKQAEKAKKEAGSPEPAEEKK